MQVFVGSSDELFLPEQMQRIFHSQRPEALVEVLPGLGHSEMVTTKKPSRRSLTRVGKARLDDRFKAANLKSLTSSGRQ